MILGDKTESSSSTPPFQRWLSNLDYVKFKLQSRETMLISFLEKPVDGVELPSTVPLKAVGVLISELTDFEQ